VVSGDFNGDGKVDLAVTDEFSVYAVWNLGGNFKFTFTKVVSYLTPPASRQWT
jgi:hypothetical protein